MALGFPPVSAVLPTTSAVTAGSRKGSRTHKPAGQACRHRTPANPWCARGSRRLPPGRPPAGLIQFARPGRAAVRPRPQAKPNERRAGTSSSKASCSHDAPNMNDFGRGQLITWRAPHFAGGSGAPSSSSTRSSKARFFPATKRRYPSGSIHALMPSVSARFRLPARS